jgi:hypothetical protein
MVHFQTKNIFFVNFGRALNRKRLTYFVANRNIGNIVNLSILRPFGKLVPIWYIFPHFGMLSQEKSGNPGLNGIYFTRVQELLNTRKKRGSRSTGLATKRGKIEEERQATYVHVNGMREIGATYILTFSRYCNFNS